MRVHLPKIIDVAPNYSKSYIHRNLVAALLCQKPVTIKNISYSEDVKVTLNCLKSIGVKIKKENNAIVVDASGKLYPKKIDFGESGSSLRFLIPVFIYLFGKITYTGSGNLLRRPLGVYEEIFDVYKMGDQVEISGQLKAGEFDLSNEVSSQTTTGLLFVLPLLKGSSQITIASSAAHKYIDITLKVLNDFGIKINKSEQGYQILGQQIYRPAQVNNPLDQSSLAYLKALKFYGFDVRNSLKVDLLQPDAIIGEIIAKQPAEIDCQNCPDLVPTLIFVCNKFNHLTRLNNVANLRYKESDRLAAILDFAQEVNLNLKLEGTSLIINPTNKLRAARVRSYADHRIALMIVLFSTQVDLEIDQIECIKKSYPQFYDFIIKNSKERDERIFK